VSLVKVAGILVPSKWWENNRNVQQDKDATTRKPLFHTTLVTKYRKSSELIIKEIAVQLSFYMH
jgi:hypothetical protein